MEATYRFERPEAVKELPYDPDPDLEGHVVAEVGVHEDGTNNDFWKTLERIGRADGDVTVRLSYYKLVRGDWKEKCRPATLEAGVLEDLYRRAREAGLFHPGKLPRAKLSARSDAYVAPESDIGNG